MRLTIILFITTIFLGCSKKQDKSTVYYIIKHPDITKSDTSDMPPPPPPPALFYGQHNFILFDSARIFYHNKHVFYTCGTGLDRSKPPHLFLTPDSLTEIMPNELPNFLTANIPSRNSNERHFAVIISSQTDTITNGAYKIITDFLKMKQINTVGARNWTEEEKYVVLSKVNNKKYNSDSVDWKIGFDSKFTPPTN